MKIVICPYIYFIYSCFTISLKITIEILVKGKTHLLNPKGFNFETKLSIVQFTVKTKVKFFTLL